MTNKLKVALVIGLVFLAGFAAGMVVTRGVVRHWVAQAVLKPDRIRELIQRRMTSRLHLSPEQQRQSAAILEQTQSDLKSLRREFAPRFTLILSNTESEISAILTPEQREQFRRFKEENRHLLQPR